MPTSVLLAVLAAAALLALAPALVRRYDATERLAAERAYSTARVLSRQRRRRSVPGRTPVNASRILVVTLRSAAPPERAPADPDHTADDRSRAGSADRPHPVNRIAAERRTVNRGRAGGGVHRTPDRRRIPRGPSALQRRRRVLAALLLLNTAELVGVIVVGPGFWVGAAVTGSLLVLFIGHLRTLALTERRRRRAEARREAWLFARQAEVRRAQERRTAARREAQKRLAAQREAVRRAISGQDKQSTVRGQPYSIRYGDPRGDSRAASL